MTYTGRSGSASAEDGQALRLALLFLDERQEAPLGPEDGDGAAARVRLGHLQPYAVAEQPGPPGVDVPAGERGRGRVGDRQHGQLLLQLVQRPGGVQLV